MQWVSTLSVTQRLNEAVTEVADAARAALGGVRPDLAVVFASPQHAAEYERVPELLRAQLDPAVLVGCSAGGVIGDGREVEGAPGLSVTAAVLPGVRVRPFHLSGGAPLPLAPGDDSSLVLLADPMSFDTERFLRAVEAAHPASTVVGGLASGGHEPGANALFLDGAVHRAGLVGVALDGDVAIETIVAQGCRPVGDPMFVTRAEGNVLYELDGRPAIEVLHELHLRSSKEDKALFRGSLFLGLVMHADEESYRQGDFLIRNILGIDPKTGALAVGAQLHEQQVVQFHLRDARTSAEDLDALLARHKAAEAGAPAGALLFSCLGRGRHLYGRPDHDTDAFRRHLGPVPLGGFFCNGEIGPVEGRTFLHGYTSSFGLFRPRGRTAVPT
jgi:small ligand-binding sensory domain FIST